MIGAILLAGTLALLSATPPRLLPKPRKEPGYSEQARRARIEGTVALTLTIGIDGHVINTKVVRSLGYGLDESATEAVRTWEFSPATDDKGNAVEATIPVECEFHLLDKRQQN